MKKGKITIEWDDDVHNIDVKIEPKNGITKLELLSILEFVKLNIFQNSEVINK